MKLLVMTLSCFLLRSETIHNLMLYIQSNISKTYYEGEEGFELCILQEQFTEKPRR